MGREPRVSNQSVDSGAPVIYKQKRVHKAQSDTQLRGAEEAKQERPRTSSSEDAQAPLTAPLHLQDGFEFEGGSSFFDLKGLRL